MDPATIHHVYFESNAKETDVTSGTTLLDAARQAGIDLPSACGGNGKCCQCRVITEEDSASAPTTAEQEALTTTELKQGYRLACCATVLNDMKIKMPPESFVTEMQMQLNGDAQLMDVDPTICSQEIKIGRSVMDDPRTESDQIANKLFESLDRPELFTEPAVLRQLSTAARQNDGQLTAYIRDKEVIGFAPLNTQPLGMAVDLGTTKIAGYLVDLVSGETLAKTGAINPQTAYGADIMTRLKHAFQDSARKTLTRSVRKTLNRMLIELTNSSGFKPEHVADICIAGNTAMTHLLTDLPVHQLALSPYVAATHSEMNLKSRDLDLNAAPGAHVHILPLIGGFVGADTVAMILSSGLDRSDHVALGVDIGTNTEIVLSKPHERNLISASCPSGPAFEGAHISHGLRAAAGAIEATRITSSGVELKTIDNAPAIGLCGSGIIDAIAELRRWDLINERGRFRTDARRVRQGRRGAEFVFAAGSKNGTGRDVTVGQKDVNEVQLAKGSIRAGIDVLLEATETAKEDVKEVLIAGAFGSYLNMKNALDIGLLPRFPNALFKQVGNAAITGAKLALLSRRLRERAIKIAAKTRNIELSTYPGFNRIFALAMLLPKQNASYTTNRKSGIMK